MAFVRCCSRFLSPKSRDIYLQSLRRCSIPRITRPQRGFPASSVSHTDGPRKLTRRPAKATRHEDINFDEIVPDQRLRSSRPAYPEIKQMQVPRITVPPKVADRLHDKKIKLLEKKVDVDPQFLGPVQINCRRTSLNHHKNQKYGKFRSNELASAHWKKPKYVGDFFSFNALERNPALFEKNRKERNFPETGLRQDICDVLEEYNIEVPTRIQSSTIPVLLSGKNVMCSSETGSGKTLAFLLPMVQKVLDHRDEFGPHKKRNQPLGVILAPSHELADQIYDVTQDLAGPLDFRVVSLVGRFSTRQLNRKNQKRMDILIATPGVLSKAIALRYINVDRVSTYVFDEADILFDDSFKFIMERLLSRATIRAAAYLSTKPVADKDQNTEAPHNHDDTVDSMEESLEYPKPIEKDEDGRVMFSSSTWQKDIKVKKDSKSADLDSRSRKLNEHIEEREADHVDESNAYLLGTFFSQSEKEHSNPLDKSETLNSDDSDSEHLEGNVKQCHSEELLDNVETSVFAHEESDTYSLGVQEESDSDTLGLLEESDTESTSILEESDTEPEVVEQTSMVQWCMVGATIPITAEDSLLELAPKESIEVVKTDGIHKVLPHITQRFVRVSTHNRNELLLKALEKNGKKRVPTIVFCNKSATVRYLQHLLTDNGVKSLSALYKIPASKGDRRGIFSDWHKENTDILITTDLASRGLDTTRAKMVINFDFPGHMADYVHRAGRVGRVGCNGVGQVLNFVLHKWDVELLWRIEMAVRRNSPLYGVHRNVKRYHEQRHSKKAQRGSIAIHV